MAKSRFMQNKKWLEGFTHKMTNYAYFNIPLLLFKECKHTFFNFESWFNKIVQNECAPK